ncbi:ABC transporter permease subunit, partial [Jeotgalibaca porci]|uniref:ABC transporter permease subunit n=1 Tax=Jeotgalibaca porci TaxID=1868793 RepID=UPI0035A1071A
MKLYVSFRSSVIVNVEINKSTSQNRLLKGIARIYVEFFQNIPLVIQIFFMYNGLAMAGLVLSEFTIGVIGVGLYHGAYI